MRRRSLVIAIAIALPIAGAAAYGLHAWSRAAGDIRAVTAAPDSPSLSADRIASMLASADFKERIQARRQIERLPEDERVSVLESLSKDGRAEVRLLAVSGMEAVRTVPHVRDVLSHLAASDPDPDVRASADRLAAGGGP